MSLGRVLDDKKIMFACEFQNRVHVRCLTKKMDRNNRLRSGRESLPQLDRVHRVCALINIDKHRPSRTEGDRFRGGHEGAGHSYYLVARPDAAGQEREPERLGAAAET